MSKKLSFTVKDGLGLNNPVIKVSNGDEIVVTGMSYKDTGKNRKNLRTTSEMTDHYIEDFELTGVGGKKYLVTREVTIFDPKAKVKGGRFKSEIKSVSLIEDIKIKRSVNSVVNNILSGTPVMEALGMFGEDDSFFTKEELLEFASTVVDEINDYYKSVNSPFSVDYTGVWVEDDDRTITVDFICFPNETNYSVSVKVDMRAINAPNDIFKLVPEMANKVKDLISDEEVVEGSSIKVLAVNEAQEPNYLIQFVDRAADKSDKVKVYAKDMESARKIAYSLPQAKSHKYSDVWISELKSGAQVFGVTFNYVDNGRKGRQILFIKAKYEDQAKAYYNKHFKGKTFWQPKPEKIDPDGGCVYSDVYDIDYTTISPDDFTGPDATVKESKSIFESTSDIKEAFAVYTGGNIWLFYGKLKDGTWFLTDDYGATLILDADPSDLDESTYQEWQDEHKIKELSGKELEKFDDALLDKLLSYPSNDYKHTGGISDSEIDAYRKYFKSI